MQTESIAYVGFREHHRDATYGTGEWVKGQVKRVDAAIAAKMLRHTDVYVVSFLPKCDHADVVEQQPSKSEKESTEAAVQDALDVVQAMDTDALVEFTQRNFNMKLDRRKSVGNLRIETQQLIHQFGLPQ